MNLHRTLIIFTVTLFAVLAQAQNNYDCLILTVSDSEVSQYLEFNVKKHPAQTRQDSIDLYTLAIMGHVWAYNQGAAQELIKEAERNIPEIKHYVPFCFYAGTNSFFQQDIIGSNFYFHQALDSNANWGCYHGNDSIQLYSSINLNLGTLLNRLRYYNAALTHYKKVTIVPNNRALMINNLSGVYLNLGNHAIALSEIDKLNENDWAQGDIAVAAKHNRLAAFVEMGRLEEAKKVYKTIRPIDVPYGDTLSHVSLFINYALLASDTLSFLATTSQYREFIESHPNIGAQKELALCVPMLEEHSKSPAKFKTMWKVLESSVVDSKMTASKNTISWQFSWSDLNRKTQLAYVGTLVLFVVLSFLLGYLLSKKSTERRVLANLSLSTLDELVAKAQQGSSSSAPALDDKSQERLDEFMKTLTVTEAKLLNMLRENNSSKEISVELRCSVGHVYNLRSALRKKFELYFTETTIDDWLKGKTKLE
jgi:tetratricopeptide (TPR) repeat protein/DNA-binding CsgD family transcriptional regulator